MSAEVLDHYHTYGRREGEEDFPNTLISGISTFLGARVIPPVKDQLVDAGVKAAVLGMPWEGTNTCRPGASYGPRAIRRATEHYLSYHGEFQVDLFDALGLADCGDVAIVPGNARGPSIAPSAASLRSTKPARSRSSSVATTPARFP